MGPRLAYTHFVAQRTDLVIYDSVKFDDKYLENFDQNLDAIFKFYYVSLVRRKKLKKIGDMFGPEFRQLWLMKNIGRAASRARSLNIIEINYEVLVSVLDSNSKSCGTNKTSKKVSAYL